MQDSITKRVEGVEREEAGRHASSMSRRKRAFCCATGGYEGDMQMYRDFNGGDTIYNARLSVCHAATA